MGKRNLNVNAFNFIVSCVIIPAAARRRKCYFLGKKLDWGNFPSTLDSPTAGANTGLGKKKHFSQKNLWRLQLTLSNCLWQNGGFTTWREGPTQTHHYQQMCNKRTSCAQTLSLLSQHKSIDAVEIVRRRRFALEMWWKSGSGNIECNSEWQRIL